MRVQDLDVTHTIQLLQDILELKEKGRQAKSEEEILNKTQKWNTKNNLLDILELTKNSGAKYGANWVAGVGRFTSLNGGVLANWGSLLNAIFNKDIAQKYSLLKDEADAQVNKLVGGAVDKNGNPTSQHCKGQAADFSIKGMSVASIVDFIKRNGFEYDQLINEYDKWVHISFVKGKNRKQCFKIS